MTTEKKSYVLPIIMMIALFGMIAFVTNLAAPMGQVLKVQFGASNFQGLLGNAANFIAYAVMGIPAGILVQRLGYKKTALIAIATGFLGVFVQFLSGHMSQNAAFSIYLLGAFVAGFSMCLLNTVVNPMLNTLGGSGNKGNQLIQVGGSFNSLMATLTPALVGIVLGVAIKGETTNISISIKDVFPLLYIAMGIFALVFLVMLVVKIPEPHISHGKEPLKQLITGALKYKHFVLGAIAIFVYVGIEVGTPGIMILWLSPEIGTESAMSLASAYWLLMLLGRILGASVGNKISSQLMLSVMSAVGLVLIILTLLFPTSNMVSIPAVGEVYLFGENLVPINAIFIVLVGLCTSIMWGSIFNLAVEGLGKYTAAASGIFMVMVCGGGILPAIQGYVADKAGYLISYLVIFVGLAYLLFYALTGSRIRNKEIQTQ
ncbi:MAG: MFS transporter [Sphaerochaetaceae bacterium]|nr:MFS transporter [Sphaerochaetaceae bacterium]